jgi:RNA polymerase sigma factor (sigma-70 family)
MTNTQASVSTWSPVLEQIRTGSESAVEELYKSLRSIHFFFKREIWRDRAGDAYHNLIITVVGAIKSGTLRQAEALPAYAMTIARRMVSEDLKEVIRARRNPDVEHLSLIARSQNPEQLALRSEREAIAKRILTALPPMGQEILIRFYINGESQAEIVAAMGITGTQFRLEKSRAKLKFAEHVKQSLNRIPYRKPVLSVSRMSRKAIA